uniref:Casein kinase I n=1 Tax=Alexandrium monilatum TaxID=311494 RepID=A0A7S4VVV6_9DINO
MLSGRGGGHRPQIVQQSGPTMQEIESAMDQMMCQALEQCKAMYEARVTTLEGLVEQQQAQLQHLQQLGVLDSRVSQLAHEVSALHLEHTVLRDDSQAAAECLLGSGALPAPLLHARRKACQSLSAFRSLMESPERVQAMEGLLGGRAAEVAHLGAASRGFREARRVAREKAPQQTARAAEDIDEEAFQQLRDFEPPRAELDKWEKSVTVHTVIGSLKVEGLIGKTDALKYSDVFKIFSQLGLTLDQFVEKFTTVRRTRTAEHLEEMAGKVLERLSSQRAEKGVISCRDVYRLLEIVGYPLRRFKAVISGSDDHEQAQATQKLGGYRIRAQIGQGRSGSASYLGEHVSDQTRVAIKWPAPRDELAVLKEIQRAAPKGCLGLPKLLAHGDCQREPYFVTELLGSPLSRVFQCLDGSDRKWPALRVIGRLVLRRLQALHACGFVHCDISPENIVLGRARESAGGGPLLTLYLVDFEHAQKYPGGRALGVDASSAEWSSIRSGDGGERLPEDDLEALGWVLTNGLLGDLPWFPWLAAAYKDWDSQWTRHQAAKQVQSAKTHFLNGGWRALSSRKAVKMPVELSGFIPACRPENAVPGKPDYTSLMALLGGSRDVGSEEAEQDDLRQLTEHISEL